MECPYCESAMFYLRDSVKQKCHIWYCKCCGEEIPHPLAREVAREREAEMRAALVAKLERNRQEEGGN